eukprot:11019178-Alexandrium_andersonii.AAC.1
MTIRCLGQQPRFHRKFAGSYIRLSMSCVNYDLVSRDAPTRHLLEISRVWLRAECDPSSTRPFPGP